MGKTVYNSLLGQGGRQLLTSNVSNCLVQDGTGQFLPATEDAGKILGLTARGGAATVLHSVATFLGLLLQQAAI